MYYRQPSIADDCCYNNINLGGTTMDTQLWILQSWPTTSSVLCWFKTTADPRMRSVLYPFNILNIRWFVYYRYGLRCTWDKIRRVAFWKEGCWILNGGGLYCSYTFVQAKLAVMIEDAKALQQKYSPRVCTNECSSVQNELSCVPLGCGKNEASGGARSGNASTLVSSLSCCRSAINSSPLPLSQTPIVYSKTCSTIICQVECIFSYFVACHTWRIVWPQWGSSHKIHRYLILRFMTYLWIIFCALSWVEHHPIIWSD